MSMGNVPWADDTDELRNERPKLRQDLPFGQAPPPPDMEAPMARPFGGDMAQLQANADANANPQLGSPLSSWKDSPLVAKARELREKAAIAESVGDQAMARTQARPIGVSDKMYRQLEANAKKEADPRLESPIASKGGGEFKRDGLVRENPFDGPTDAELEKRMSEGPKAKDVKKWDEEYGGHAAAAKPKAKAKGSDKKSDHLADVAAMLKRLKASQKGTKDENPRSYGPWADKYEAKDEDGKERSFGPWADNYVTSDANAKREAYELGVKAGSGQPAAAKEGEAMFMRGEQTVRAPKGGFDTRQDEIDENGKVSPKDTLRRRLTLDPSPESPAYVKPGEVVFTRGNGQRVVAPAEGFDPQMQEMDENGKTHNRLVRKDSDEDKARLAKEHNDFVGPSLGQRYPEAFEAAGKAPDRIFQTIKGATGSGLPSAIMNRLRGKK